MEKRVWGLGSGVYLGFRVSSPAYREEEQIKVQDIQTNLSTGCGEGGFISSWHNDQREKGLYVCMYIYIYMYVYVYVCMYVFMYACMHVCMYV